MYGYNSKVQYSLWYFAGLGRVCTTTRQTRATQDQSNEEVEQAVAIKKGKEAAENYSQSDGNIEIEERM